MDDPTAGRYDMIIVIDLYTKLVIDLNLSTNNTECDEEPYQRCKIPRENLNFYEFETINRNMRPCLEE